MKLCLALEAPNLGPQPPVLEVRVHMSPGDQYQTQSSSWRSLGLKGVKERRLLSVIHCWSWCIPGHNLLPGSPASVPQRGTWRAGTPRLPKRTILLPQPSCHCPSRQRHFGLEDVSLPYLLLSVLSALYFFPHSPTQSSPQAATLLYTSAALSQVLLPQETMLSRVWGHPVVFTLMGLLASRGRAREAASHPPMPRMAPQKLTNLVSALERGRGWT